MLPYRLRALLLVDRWLLLLLLCLSALLQRAAASKQRSKTP
jgi:hypothetical protein